MLSKHQTLIILFFSFAGLMAQEKKKSFKESLITSLVIEMDASYDFKSESLQKTEFLIKPETLLVLMCKSVQQHSVCF